MGLNTYRYVSVPFCLNMVNVFMDVPTIVGFWITLFAATIKPMLSSSVLPAPKSAAAER